MIQFHLVLADNEKSRGREEKHKVFRWILVFYLFNTGFYKIGYIFERFEYH